MAEIFYEAKATTSVELKEYGKEPLPVKPGFDFSLERTFHVLDAKGDEVNLPEKPNKGKTKIFPLELPDGLAGGSNFLQIKVENFDSESLQCTPGVKTGLYFWFDGKNPKWKLKKDTIAFFGAEILSDKLCIANYSPRRVRFIARWIETTGEPLINEGLELAASELHTASQEHELVGAP